MPSSSTSFACAFTIRSSPLNLSSPPHLSLSNPFPPLPLRIQSTQSSRVLRVPPPLLECRSRTRAAPSAMATGSVQEVLPPALDSTSDPPAIFDGTTRLYISYSCPYAQRVWIARNCKGLQDKIKLVPIELQNRPTWYKEKVYPPNKGLRSPCIVLEKPALAYVANIKWALISMFTEDENEMIQKQLNVVVPSLEHNNEVKGESLDLLKYIDNSFEGPSLLPSDPAKRQFAEELLAYTDSLNKGVISSFKAEGMNDADAAFDHFETALSKFDEGPFLLAEFSLVDIAYAPFVERFQPFLLELKNYDIAAGRPKLAAWIQEMNKIEAYKETRRDPNEHVESYKKRFLAQV